MIKMSPFKCDSNWVSCWVYVKNWGQNVRQSSSMRGIRNLKLVDTSLTVDLSNKSRPVTIAPKLVVFETHEMSSYNPIVQ